MEKAQSRGRDAGKKTKIETDLGIHRVLKCTNIDFISTLPSEGYYRRKGTKSSPCSIRADIQSS